MKHTTAQQTMEKSKEVYPGIFNETGDYFKEVIAFADKMNLLESFDNAMSSMRRKTKNSYIIHLYKDYAPYSFYFVQFYEGKEAGNGGIIYHGPHDAYGSGRAPTFSVTIEKVYGWSIHT